MLLTRLATGICLFSLLSPYAIAEFKPGIGVSLMEDGTRIYFPVDLYREGRKSLRFEPLLSVARGNRSTEEDSGLSSRDQWNYLDAGLGLLVLNGVVDDLQVYYGVRGLASRSHSEESDSSGYDGSITGHGWELSAVTGVEYVVVPGLAVAAEAGVYRRVLHTVSRDDYDRYETRSSIGGSSANFIVRYHF